MDRLLYSNSKAKPEYFVWKIFTRGIYWLFRNFTRVWLAPIWANKTHSRSHTHAHRERWTCMCVCVLGKSIFSVIYIICRTVCAALSSPSSCSCYKTHTVDHLYSFRSAMFIKSSAWRRSERESARKRNAGRVEVMKHRACAGRLKNPLNPAIFRDLPLRHTHTPRVAIARGISKKRVQLGLFGLATWNSRVRLINAARYMVHCRAVFVMRHWLRMGRHLGFVVYKIQIKCFLQCLAI